ncbi:MAG: ABC transporter permease [Caldilineaceae bacterium]|nr:ABC transporter permease [Caldilineaceae bacterium]
MIRQPLLRLAWRHSWRRPLQSVFLIVGVAIGVAMIVAIDLANGSANRAFALGAEQVTGKATHQIVGGPDGLETAVYARLRRELGFRMSAPVVESYVSAPQLDGQPMRLLGIDPFAEPPFRSYLGGSLIQTDGTAPGAGNFLAPFLLQPNSVLIGQSVAERYGLQPGQRLSIGIGARQQTLTIIGLLAPTDELSRRALEGLLIVDISTAQEALGKVGRLDRIDLILPTDAGGAAKRGEIEAILPPGARIVRPSARTATVEEMTAAFRLNLTALSLLALVVGMFLIYNTVSFSVVQRRPVLGILRALGVTRRELFVMILTEAAYLGLIGTALGLLLGVLMGRGAVQAVTRTINDLFFVVAVRNADVPLWTLAKGALSGIGAALLAAVVPALEATSVPPAGALQRSDVEEKARRALPRLTAAGVALCLLGAGMLVPEWSLAVAFGGLFAVILGAALLTPALTLLLMELLHRFLSRRLGILTRMAPRNIIRSLSRTAVAIAALMVAVSVIIGVGVMIVSFRLTVEQWLDEILQADIFVSAPALGPNRNDATLEPALLEDLAVFPAIVGFSTSREVGVSVTMPDGRQGEVQLAAVLRDLAGADRRYRAAVGDTDATWAAVEAGGVVINETMANRFDVGVGQKLEILTDGGVRSFPVVGITYDFDVNPTILIDDGSYRRHWNDRFLTTIALFVEPGADVDGTVNALRRSYAGKAELLISSNRGVRLNALEVFDRTFAITVALRLLATLVAFVGILSTLLSLQLERARELGVLRATGMTRRQLWGLTLLETGLIGTSAGLAALPTGFILALILVYIINLRSFGWTLSMQVPAGEFTQAFLVALAAALLAGLYPAWRMGRTDPAEALRME